MSVIRAVLADDHPVFRYGVADLLASTREVSIVAAVDGGTAALDAVTTLKPDVAILDISMPDMNGVTVVRALAERKIATRAIMLSVYEHKVYIEQAFDAGASGYVLKRSAFENIASAVKAVHAGGIYVDPALPGRGRPNHSRLHHEIEARTTSAVSVREKEVLRLIAFGYTSKEVAGRLGWSSKLVEAHKARVCTKLGIASRAQIVQFAILQGWLQGEMPV